MFGAVVVCCASLSNFMLLGLNAQSWHIAHNLLHYPVVGPSPAYSSEHTLFTQGTQTDKMTRSHWPRTDVNGGREGGGG